MNAVKYAGALTLAVLAACGDGKPAAQASETKPLTGALAGVVVTSDDPRGAIFLSKGCPQCHTISALGIKSPAEVGPDLTVAYEDVQNRFGLKLDEFLRTPTGTMQVVLSSQIQLSPAERDSIYRILHALHEEQEERAEHSTKP